MAGTIKGITIEIEGKTSGLVKSLGNVNKSLSETQKSLKTVNEALKLDPKNLDTLKTKQNLLNQAIEETKEKLKLEQQAAKDAAKALEDGTITKNQYDTLQAEVSKTSGELKKLEGQANETNQQIKELGGSSKLKSFESALDQAQSKLNNLGDKLTSVGKQLTMKVSLPLIGLGGAAVKTAAGFESSMAKVAAVSGARGEDLEALSAKAREMGANTKYSASEAADALNYMAMAGWKTEDMLGGIEGIMTLAAASGEDLATTSDIVTDALTAFGMTADESGRFADVLAAASSNANTNVSMLGESFKYVAPVAGAMGYSAEDTAIALGLMANAGIKASQGGTALRTLLTNMANPTDKMEGAMARLGVSLQDDEGNMKSLRDIMIDLRGGMEGLGVSSEEFNEQLHVLDDALERGGLTEAQYMKALDELCDEYYTAEDAQKAQTAALLAGKTGLSGLLAIVNASPEDFEKLTAAIDGSAGVSQEMADIMSNTLEGRVAEMKSKIEELGIQFGEKLIPILEKVIGWISDLADWFNNLDDDTQDTITTIGLLIIALGPVLSAIGGVVTAIGGMIGAFKGIRTALTGAGGLNAVLSGTALGPLAAVALAISAIVLWIQNWDDICEVFQFVWEKVCEGIQHAILWVTEAWANFIGYFTNSCENVKKAAQDALALAQEMAAIENGKTQLGQNMSEFVKKYAVNGGKTTAEVQGESNRQMADRYKPKANNKTDSSHYVNIYMDSNRVGGVVSTSTSTTNTRGGGH